MSKFVWFKYGKENNTAYVIYKENPTQALCIRLDSVTDGKVKAIGIDKSANILYVVFKNDNAYAIFNITKNVIEQIINSSSVEEYIQKKLIFEKFSISQEYVDKD